MSTIALPSWFTVAGFDAQLVPEVRGFASPYGGPTEMLDLLGDRWRFVLTLPDDEFANGARREVLFNQLRGGADWLSLYHFARPVPAGTLFSSTGLASSAVQGANLISLGGVRTLKNLLVHTRAFGNAVWADTAQVTSDTHVNPFSSSMTADTITDSSTTVRQAVTQTVTVPNDNQAYTGSIYVRKTSGGTSPTFVLGLFLSGGSSTVVNYPRINTDLGTVLGSTGTATVTAQGSDWWRVAVTVTNDSTGHTSLGMTVCPANSPYNVNAFDPTTTGSAVVSHAQIELGTTATSPEATPTLLAGDIIGMGGQLLMVAEDTTTGTSGFLTVTLVNRLRAAVTAGAAVTVQRPTAPFQLVDAGGVPTSYVPGRARGQTVEFIEAWA